MIYIQKDTKIIQIPKHVDTYNTEFTLVLYNPIDNKSYSFSGLRSVGTDLIYEFEDLNFSDLTNGEYEYSLSDVEQTLENGLVQIGDYKKINKQYETTTTGKQYNG